VPWHFIAPREREGEEGEKEQVREDHIDICRAEFELELGKDERAAEEPTLFWCVRCCNWDSFIIVVYTCNGVRRCEKRDQKFPFQSSVILDFTIL
jgi:hypothetical protein